MAFDTSRPIVRPPRLLGSHAPFDPLVRSLPVRVGARHCRSRFAMEGVAGLESTRKSFDHPRNEPHHPSESIWVSAQLCPMSPDRAPQRCARASSCHTRSVQSPPSIHPQELRTRHRSARQPRPEMSAKLAETQDSRGWRSSSLEFDFDVLALRQFVRQIRLELHRINGRGHLPDHDELTLVLILLGRRCSTT